MEEGVFRILFVDDDADDHDIFTEAVRSINAQYHLFHAYHCDDLFRVLRSQEVDIIFMDIRMPLRDGKACLKELKAEKAFAMIPVIMFSTSKHDIDIDLAYEGGAHYYIIKPSDYIEIVKALSDVLKQDWKGPLGQPSREDFVKGRIDEESYT